LINRPILEKETKMFKIIITTALLSISCFTLTQAAEITDKDKVKIEHYDPIVTKHWGKKDTATSIQPSTKHPVALGPSETRLPGGNGGATGRPGGR
jgi:hypothetical protein